MYSVLAINVAIILFTSFAIIRTVHSVFPQCQARRITGEMLVSLPLATLIKLQRHYAKHEQVMDSVDDEFEAMKDVLNGADPVLPPEDKKDSFTSSSSSKDQSFNPTGSCIGHLNPSSIGHLNPSVQVGTTRDQAHERAESLELFDTTQSEGAAGVRSPLPRNARSEEDSGGDCDSSAIDDSGRDSPVIATAQPQPLTESNLDLFVRRMVTRNVSFLHSGSESEVADEFKSVESLGVGHASSRGGRRESGCESLGFGNSASRASSHGGRRGSAFSRENERFSRAGNFVDERSLERIPSDFASNESDRHGGDISPNGGMAAMSRPNIPLKSPMSTPLPILKKSCVTIDSVNVEVFPQAEYGESGSDDDDYEAKGSGPASSSTSATLRNSLSRPENANTWSSIKQHYDKIFLQKGSGGKRDEDESLVNELERPGGSFDENSRIELTSALPWYHRTPVYWFALTIVMILNVLLWMMPHSSLKSLLNTAHLQRASYQAEGTVGLCLYAGRELVLRDGFSYMSAAQLHSYLSVCTQSFYEQTTVMRQGGVTSLAASAIEVFTGADIISSNAMDKYKAAMYKVSMHQMWLAS